MIDSSSPLAPQSTCCKAPVGCICPEGYKGARPDWCRRCSACGKVCDDQPSPEASEAKSSLPKEGDCGNTQNTANSEASVQFSESLEGFSRWIWSLSPHNFLAPSKKYDPQHGELSEKVKRVITELPLLRSISELEAQRDAWRKAAEGMKRYLEEICDSGNGYFADQDPKVIPEWARAIAKSQRIIAEEALKSFPLPQ